ncbi:MAG: SufS family cysteine desulfurase [Thaumarchaeota archaeon]|jgi:cysteine desulfurase/selenocysteine lyase|nr:SufS family cysteine desulfurase [Nitrososphaerota archaeon]
MNSIEKHIDEIRNDFPILSLKDFAYLDNAATSQKPIQVIEKINLIYKTLNANVHRGIYKIAENITEEYEQSRKEISSFINASENEIIFTKNTTDSINLVAYSLLQKLKKGDKVVTTFLEHHSNLLPWRKISEIAGLKLELVKVTPEGLIDEEDYEKKVQDAKVVAFTHVSNVAGTIVEAKQLVKKAKESGALVLIDGAQAAPHLKVDVRELGTDFYAFSGHKMLGPTGIGILYGRKELLEDLEPPFTGGEMVKEVHKEGQSWNDIPWKFEPGTPNYVGAIGLAEAVKYIKKIGIDEIAHYEKKLAEYLLEAVEKIKGLRYVGPQKNRAALVAFETKGIHPHDVAAFLDMKGIAVRSGWHCAQPLQEELGFLNGTTRASLYFYNTFSEIDKLKVALEELVKMV